jgi:hypothetical protein
LYANFCPIPLKYQVKHAKRSGRGLNYITSSKELEEEAVELDQKEQDNEACVVAEEEKYDISNIVDEEKCDIPNMVDEERCDILNMVDEEKCDIPNIVGEEKCDIPNMVDEEKCDIPNMVYQERGDIPNMADEEQCDISNMMDEMDNEYVQIPEIGGGVGEPRKMVQLLHAGLVATAGILYSMSLGQ